MKQGNEAAAIPFAFRLDSQSGVPVYRQLIDQVQAGLAVGKFVKEPFDEEARRNMFGQAA